MSTYLWAVMSTIGERLKSERRRLGFSQEDFAAVAGVTRRPYADWESGNTSPTAVQLAKFAGAEVDVLYVVTGQRSVAAVPTLAPDEAALLDNYRNSPKEARDALKATSAALAKSVGSEVKRKAG